MAAVVTLAARNVVENDDAIAGSKAGTAGTNGGDHAGRFVAEDSGSRMRTSGDLFQIRAANSASMNPKQQLSGADLWNGNSFQADIVHSAVNSSQHSCGD
jgi:hypothetical protein